MRIQEIGSDIIQLYFPGTHGAPDWGHEFAWNPESDQAHRVIQTVLCRTDLYLRSEIGENFHLLPEHLQWQLDLKGDEPHYQPPRFHRDQLPIWTQNFLSDLEPLLAYFGTKLNQVLYENGHFFFVYYNGRPFYREPGSERFGRVKTYIHYHPESSYFDVETTLTVGGIGIAIPDAKMLIRDHPFACERSMHFRIYMQPQYHLIDHLIDLQREGPLSWSTTEFRNPTSVAKQALYTPSNSLYHFVRVGTFIRIHKDLLYLDATFLTHYIHTVEEYEPLISFLAEGNTLKRLLSDMPTCAQKQLPILRDYFEKWLGTVILDDHNRLLWQTLQGTLSLERRRAFRWKENLITSERIADHLLNAEWALICKEAPKHTSIFRDAVSVSVSYLEAEFIKARLENRESLDVILQLLQCIFHVLRLSIADTETRLQFSVFFSVLSEWIKRAMVIIDQPHDRLARYLEWIQWTTLSIFTHQLLLFFDFLRKVLIIAETQCTTDLFKQHFLRMQQYWTRYVAKPIDDSCQSGDMFDLEILSSYTISIELHHVITEDELISVDSNTIGDIQNDCAALFYAIQTNKELNRHYPEFLDYLLNWLVNFRYRLMQRQQPAMRNEDALLIVSVLQACKQDISCIDMDFLCEKIAQYSGEHVELFSIDTWTHLMKNPIALSCLQDMIVWYWMKHFSLPTSTDPLKKIVHTLLCKILNKYVEKPASLPLALSLQILSVLHTEPEMRQTQLHWHPIIPLLFRSGITKRNVEALREWMNLWHAIDQVNPKRGIGILQDAEISLQDFHFILEEQFPVRSQAIFQRLVNPVTHTDEKSRLMQLIRAAQNFSREDRLQDSLYRMGFYVALIEIQKHYAYFTHEKLMYCIRLFTLVEKNPSLNEVIKEAFSHALLHSWMPSTRESGLSLFVRTEDNPLAWMDDPIQMQRYTTAFNTLLLDITIQTPDQVQLIALLHEQALTRDRLNTLSHVIRPTLNPHRYQIPR